MFNYSLTVKKGKLCIQVSTTDSDFVADQLSLWIQKTKQRSKNKANKAGLESALNKIKEEEVITKQNIERQISSYSKDNVKIEEPPKQEMPKELKKKEEPKETNAKTDNLDIFYAPPTEKAFKDSVSAVINNDDGKPVFDTILENSVKNPTSELSFKPSPSIQKDNAFLTYMENRKIDRKIDYLLLTSYYFAQYEQKPRFTLKQLNAKLMQNMAVLIDHGVLQEAINRNYLECLPDLTGLIGASEYRLTSYGEKALFDE